LETSRTHDAWICSIRGNRKLNIRDSALYLNGGVIPTRIEDASSILNAGWYRARGWRGGRAPNRDKYQPALTRLWVNTKASWYDMSIGMRFVVARHRPTRRVIFEAIILTIALTHPTLAADDGGCMYQRRTYTNHTQVVTTTPVRQSGMHEVMQCLNGRWLYKACENGTTWQCRAASHDEKAITR
jgi:hypothetical protein